MGMNMKTESENKEQELLLLLSYSPWIMVMLCWQMFFWSYVAPMGNSIELKDFAKLVESHMPMLLITLCITIAFMYLPNATNKRARLLGYCVGLVPVGALSFAYEQGFNGVYSWVLAVTISSVVYWGVQKLRAMPSQ
ncbi:hypothetical protein K0504_09660 [Neiella marina]|uniref:Uncharacterized protein n=1 Tax=Neiella holothuriorum TaxID=2870530 RepID=A0ABS7EI32_9GAMM|nr:hypothetical protein [Neiella holothuriorum]MBW8191302.1 hypothetical protein [Neiella holothuriorum]